jgi:hypothetical protein
MQTGQAAEKARLLDQIAALKKAAHFVDEEVLLSGEAWK